MIHHVYWVAQGITYHMYAHEETGLLIVETSDGVIMKREGLTKKEIKDILEEFKNIKKEDNNVAGYLV
jgi:hypothetical protein